MGVFSIIVIIALFAAAFCPLFLAGFDIIKKRRSKKIALLANIASVFSLCLLIFAVSAGNVALASEGEAQAPATEATEAAAEEGVGLSVGSGLGMLAAALATGMSGVAGGIAVAASGSAAIGAISENPKVFGQALIFVALAEGIALYGLIISLQILAKI